jgi:hypothetical protein
MNMDTTITTLDTETFLCDACLQVKAIEGDGPWYGMYIENGVEKKACIPCCTALDIEHMNQKGKMVLRSAVSPETGSLELANWTGTLRFPALILNDTALVTQKQRSAIFVGPDGNPWIGIQEKGSGDFLCQRF